MYVLLRRQSTHSTQLMNNKGKIIARDIYKHKLQLIEGLASRLGVKIIEAQKHMMLKY